MADDITMQRLDQRIEWYDRHAAYNQRAYKVLKLIVIVAAALKMGNAAGKAGQEAGRLQLCPQRWLMLRRLCVRHPQRLSMRGKEDLPDPKLRYKSIRTSS